MKPTHIHSETIGRGLQALALGLAPAVALAYVAGEALGRWVHDLNRALWLFHRGLFIEQRATALTIARSCNHTATRAQLETLTVRELQAMTGLRSKRPKAFYVSRLLAA